MKQIIPRKHLYVILLFNILFIGSFALYHHHTLNQLENDMRTQLQTVASQLTTDISQVRDFSEGSVGKLNNTLGSRIAETQQKVQVSDSLRKKEIEQLQSDLTSTKAVQAQEFSRLLGEIGDVRTTSEQAMKNLEQSVADIKVRNKDFSSILDEVVEAVVSVSTNTGAGSGVIVDKRGYIITNYHVIDGASAMGVITSDGKLHRVRVVAVDRNVDLATLKIEGSFSRLDFASPSSVEVGERVIAVGNPGGLDFTVTEGIISALNRVMSNGFAYVQTDVPINPGNSGGPLVDIHGDIVGITTSKLQGFEGIGFAIPSNTVEEFYTLSLQVESS